MTPDKARELLDNATPGPWQSRGDGPSSGKPHLYVCTCEDRTKVAEAVGWDDAPLIAAAPDLAALVAGMHYEYAVQLKHGDGWIMSRHRSATHEDAKAIQARYSRAETRIVRRLVTDEEVVE